MDFWAGTAIGTLFGTVAGVIGDRLSTVFEQRVRIEAWPSMSSSAGGDRLTMHLRNAGGLPLPPYQLEIYNVARGSFAFFGNSLREPLYPWQERAHQVTLRFPQDAGSINMWIANHDPKATAAELRRFRLQVRLQDSQAILFQSARIGTALMNYLINRADDATRPIELPWDDLQHFGWVTRFRRWREHRKLMGQLHSQNTRTLIRGE